MITNWLAIFVEILNGGGVKCLYSPLMGIGAYTQGIVGVVTLSPQEKINIYKEWAEWVFSNRIAKVIKIDDYDLRENVQQYILETEYRHPLLTDIEYTARPTYNIDLTLSEDELWHNLYYKSCRYCINKAKKESLYVRQITDKIEIRQFIEIHWQQINNVSKRKHESTRVYQQKDRLYNLCTTLFPDKVLMLQVIGNDENGKEQVMASGIWLIGKTESVWWTGASFQQYMHYCPNELMLWEALKILKMKGSENLNLSGLAEYKRKFGSTITYVPRLYFRKNKHIILFDELLKTMYGKLKYIKRKLRNKL